MHLAYRFTLETSGTAGRWPYGCCAAELVSGRAVVSHTRTLRLFAVCALWVGVRWVHMSLDTCAKTRPLAGGLVERNRENQLSNRPPGRQAHPPGRFGTEGWLQLADMAGGAGPLVCALDGRLPHIRLFRSVTVHIVLRRVGYGSPASPVRCPASSYRLCLPLLSPGAGRRAAWAQVQSSTGH